MTITAFVCLTVFAVTGWAAAAVSLYLLARFSIAEGRFSTDATTKAWNLSRALDEAVRKRVLITNVTTLGSAALSGSPDANVQQRGRVDDDHETRRESERFMGDGDSVRDNFAVDEQPELVET